LPNLAHSDMCEQLQMNNQSLTGDPVGAEVCRRSRLGIANGMCGIASPRMFTFRESENIFGTGKSVLFSFFYRHSKRMYFSSTGCSSCVCSVFFVDFPKECIIPLWSFRLCLSTFQNIFRTRKPFHYLSALTSTFTCNFVLAIFQLLHVYFAKQMQYWLWDTTLVILLVFVYFSKHFPFKENRFIFCLL